MKIMLGSLASLSPIRYWRERRKGSPFALVPSLAQSRRQPTRSPSTLPALTYPSTWPAQRGMSKGGTASPLETGGNTAGHISLRNLARSPNATKSTSACYHQLTGSLIYVGRSQRWRLLRHLCASKTTSCFAHAEHASRARIERACRAICCAGQMKLRGNCLVCHIRAEQMPEEKFSCVLSQCRTTLRAGKDRQNRRRLRPRSYMDPP